MRSRSLIVLSALTSMPAVRFLNLVRPFLPILPEVSSPDCKVGSFCARPRAPPFTPRSGPLQPKGAMDGRHATHLPRHLLPIPSSPSTSSLTPALQTSAHPRANAGSARRIILPRRRSSECYHHVPEHAHARTGPANLPLHHALLGRRRSVSFLEPFLLIYLLVFSLV